MGEILNRETDGRLSLQTYPGRQLGEEKDTLEEVDFGAIDLNRINITTLTDVVPQTNSGARAVSGPPVGRDDDKTMGTACGCRKNGPETERHRQSRGRQSTLCGRRDTRL